jgi:hypothetical protein
LGAGTVAIWVLEMRGAELPQRGQTPVSSGATMVLHLRQRNCDELCLRLFELVDTEDTEVTGAIG